MFFLMRACFWMGVVWLALPAPSHGEAGPAAGRETSALRLAADAVGTAASLCRRQPTTCEAMIRTLAVPPHEEAKPTKAAEAVIPLPVPRPGKRKAG